MSPSANDLNRVGVAQVQRRQFLEAADCFRQAIAADPDSAISHINLGNALAALGNDPEAKGCYERALILDPNSVDLHFNLGVMLVRMGDHESAVTCFQRAAALDPENLRIHNRLALTLGRLDRHSEAASAFRRVLQLAPFDPKLHSILHCNLGKALTHTGDYDEGLQNFAEALRLNPNFPEGHYTYALALQLLGRLPDSLAQFDAALRLKPDYHDALIVRSVLLLLSGDYARGWREYERRIKDKSIVRATHPEPIWDGSPLAGRTLLLEAEQGMGDTIQFVRYAQEIKRHYQGRIIVAVEPQLVPLLTGIAGADVLIGQSEARPPFDIWAPLLSLPGIMKHDPSCFPAPIPYLKADGARVEKWKARLANLDGFKIGIAWQGSKGNRNDRQRSFPLTAFGPVGRLPRVRLISLQKGEGALAIATLSDFSVHTLGDDFDSTGGAFLDTAAVMKNLDLVISADTSIGHLAGALGVPVWLALAYAPDWRWTMHGECTSAYPTMRLFRQTGPGNWSSVFQQMAEAINV